MRTTAHLHAEDWLQAALVALQRADARQVESGYAEGLKWD